jgi:dCTP deaminase
MTLIQRKEIVRRLGLTDSKRLFIDPLLEEGQVGEVSVDLRLGPDFLVSLLTRKPSIDVSRGGHRSVDSFFRTTRRDLGDKFVLYPGQVVLATTLEYIGLPSDLYADILSRSSYTRLGLHLGTMIQPGYRGCFSLELFNHGNNPIELLVGSRIVQARFFKLSKSSPYQQGGTNRKYLGNVRPVVSGAQLDTELPRLLRSKS